MRWVPVAFVCLVCVPTTLCAAEKDDAEKAQIEQLRKKLEVPISVEMVKLPAARALELLARKTGVPIVLGGSPKDKSLQEPVSYSLEDVHGLDLLDVLCKQTGLEYELRPEEVRVYSATEWRRRHMKMVPYALDDITSSVNDFPAPHFGDYSCSDLSFVTSASPGMCPEQIAELIRTAIRPESWGEQPGPSIKAKSRMLLISQTEDVHALIRRLLAGLRSRAGRQVNLDAWVYAVRSNHVDRLWAELRTRGGKPPQLDDAAVAEIRKWAESGAAETLYAGSSVIYNLQRGHWGDIDQRSAVHDIDVSGSAYDPIVRARSSGTMIEASPTLSDDGRQITLSLRVEHARSAPKDQPFQVIRGGEVIDSGTSTQDIVLRRRKPEGEPKTGDVTDEFEISQTSPKTAVRRVPSYQVSLYTARLSQLCQDLVVPADGHVALSAPLCNENGLDLGREMLVLLRCRPLIAKAPRMEPEQKEESRIPEALAKRLEKKVSLTFLETPFETALSVFAKETGVPLILDPAGLAETRRQPTTWEGKDVPAGDALRALLRSGGADIIPYPSLLLITSRQRVAARQMTLRIIDLRDMNKIYPDYPGPDLQVQTVDPTDAAVGGGINNPFVTQVDMTTGLTPADFADLFTEQLLPGAFDTPPASIEEKAGQLVVFHTPEVLEKMEKMLAAFRQTVRKPITISGRWLVVNRADLAAAVGNDLPATLSVEETRKVGELAAKPETRDVTAARFTCFNTQRVHAVGMCERSYVGDYEATGDLLDPTVRKLASGAFLDVRPLIMEGTVEDGVPSQLRLDVRASLTWTDPNPTQFDPVVPEADKKGNGRPVLPGAIQTPRCGISRVRTTVRVVNGGAALFRFPLPPWIEGEDQEKAKRGDRLLILLLRAEQ